MVARTAFTQLQYSPLLLLGTVAGMKLLYVVPLTAIAAGAVQRRPSLALPGAIAYGLMTLSYLPTVARYRQARWRALTLPLAGMLYTAMTIDSALRHARGAGGLWKGRHFNAASAPPVDESTPSDA
jgi:hypothetical protein